MKGLDLVDRGPEEKWTEHCIGGSDRNIAKKKKCLKAKWLSEEALLIYEKRREVKGKGERQIHPTECRVPENSKEI